MGMASPSPAGRRGRPPPAFGTRRCALRAVRCRAPLPPVLLPWPMTTWTTTSRPTVAHGHPSRAELAYRWAHATVWPTVARLADHAKHHVATADMTDDRAQVHLAGHAAPHDPAAALCSTSITSHAPRGRRHHKRNKRQYDTGYRMP